MAQPADDISRTRPIVNIQRRELANRNVDAGQIARAEYVFELAQAHLKDRLRGSNC